MLNDAGLSPCLILVDMGTFSDSLIATFMKAQLSVLSSAIIFIVAINTSLLQKRQYSIKSMGQVNEAHERWFIKFYSFFGYLP